MPVSPEEFAGIFIDMREMLRRIHNEQMNQTQILMRILSANQHKPTTTITPVESSRPPKSWQKR